MLDQENKNRNKNTKQKHKTNYYNESDFFGIWYGCWIFFGHKLGLKRWGLDFHFLKAHSYSIQIFYCLLILFSFDWGEGGFDVNKKPLLYFIYIFILYFNWTLIPLIKEYYIKLVCNPGMVNYSNTIGQFFFVFLGLSQGG